MCGWGSWALVGWESEGVQSGKRASSFGNMTASGVCLNKGKGWGHGG
jgi:hypothetical protein